MTTRVRIYIEGGKNLRRGFSQFFRKALPNCPQPEIVLGRSREEAVNAFNKDIEQHGERFCILLVDSEGETNPNLGSKDNLQRSLAKGRKVKVGFSVTHLASDEHIYLMAQSMESWLVAHREALAIYYGQGFNTGALPNRSNVEEVAKLDLNNSLKEATKNTVKGEYRKGKHDLMLLERIDPDVVASRAPQCQRLIDKLTQLLCA